MPAENNSRARAQAPVSPRRAAVRCRLRAARGARTGIYKSAFGPDSLSFRIRTIDMTAEPLRPALLSSTALPAEFVASLLRQFAIVAGLAWSAAFVVVGVGYELQLYGDGAIFSYAVADGSSWAFHWHNIPVRSFVLLASHLPAEIYAASTGDARGAVALYGALFFCAPLVGLLLTYAVDPTRPRHFFTSACLSTACLCPLVFGCPTEMWMAHALFWPALALCHDQRSGAMRTALIFIVLTALVLTHEGAWIFAGAILATTALHGLSAIAFRRAAIVLAIAVAIWMAIRLAFPADDYIAPVMARAAFEFIDPWNFAARICLVIGAGLAMYATAFAASFRLSLLARLAVAIGVTSMAFAIYWIVFDNAVHADDRYVVRTVVLVFAPIFAAMAVVAAPPLDDRRQYRTSIDRFKRYVAAVRPFAIGALVVVMLVHVVETIKFIDSWTHYQAAVRALAIGSAADPSLGDARFVSSQRIARELRQMRWNSTTPFLSVMVAPGLAPTRLVIDPSANYFWLSCPTAMASEAAHSALPVASRSLVRIHACLHR